MTVDEFMAAWVMRYGYESVPHNEAIQFKRLFKDEIKSSSFEYDGWLLTCKKAGKLSNRRDDAWKAIKHETD